MLKRFGLWLFAAISIIYLSNQKEWKRHSLRSKLTSAVVMLTNEQGNSGGTGFQVYAASGNKYILTNDHVCELGNKTGVIYANEDGMKVPLKILYKSIYTDLCLVSPIDYRPALKLARGYEWGQSIVVVGHPLLYDDTMVDGELVQQRVIQVISHVITEENPCPKFPKFKEKDINFLFFQFPACVLEVKANWTTAQILPGSSGSPVANLSGEVVGIIFAGGAQELNRGWMIPLEDIELFLRSY